jgi:hypothetical protein
MMSSKEHHALGVGEQVLGSSFLLNALRPLSNFGKRSVSTVKTWQRQQLVTHALGGMENDR